MKKGWKKGWACDRCKGGHRRVLAKKVGRHRDGGGKSFRLGTPNPDKVVVVLLRCCWEASRQCRIGCISAVRLHFHSHFLLHHLLLRKKKGKGKRRSP